MEANNTVQDPVVPLSTLTETLIQILNRDLVPHLDDMTLANVNMLREIY
jgi:hypothetical protein